MTRNGKVGSNAMTAPRQAPATAIRTLAVVLALAGTLCAATADAQALPGSSAVTDADPSALVGVGQVNVSEIRVEGSTIFSSSELDAIVSPYENRAITTEQLHALRHELSAAYLDRGYVNSGVIIPDQRVENGVIVLQAIEGDLTAVEIDGVDRVRERAVERRIERYVGSPLSINELQSGLQVLQQDPMIERVNAELLPGAQPGQSILKLGLTEASPWEFRAGANNYRSPSVGEERGTIGLTYHGPIGNGDQLSLDLSLTEGANDKALSYRAPLGPAETSIEIYAAEQDTDIIEAPFVDIDITSHLESWGLIARRPFSRSTNHSLIGIAGFEHKRSRSTLLGLPFSFSPGDVDGRARGSAIVLGVEWTRQLTRSALAVRGTTQIGIDALDATVFDDPAFPNLPDSEFVALIGQVQYVRQLGWRDGRLLARAFFQAADDPLLAMYKAPVGGRYTVRGYRENQFVRDNATVASLEYQLPLLVDDLGRGRDSLRLAVFADYGASWDENEALSTSRKQRLSSLGLGLLWNPIDGLDAELYWGDPRSGPPSSGDSLQDDGFHYQIVYSRRF